MNNIRYLAKANNIRYSIRTKINIRSYTVIYITTSDGILNSLNQPCSGILQGYHVDPKLQDQEPS